VARRIAVAFNDDTHLKPHLNPTELLGEAAVREAAEEIAQCTGGTLIAVRDDMRSALRELQGFDIVINLCEGVLGNPRFEINFALALEMLGIAHTTCDPIVAGLCIDKVLIKKLLRAAGLPTPRGYVDPNEVPAGTFIVKPSREDAGIGIDASAVVSTAKDLAARCRYVVDTYHQPPLIEEFIDGRELNQSLYCGRVLPPGEVVFAEEWAPRERVVGWNSKWATGSAEDLGAVNRTPALIDDSTRGEVARLSLAAARLFGIDMVARIDFRQAQDGTLYIIDINPNPDIGPGSGFRKALAAGKVPFSDFLEALMMAAYARRAHEDPSRSSERSRPNS
jgi:D-alanine-D-alanine ligase